MTLTIVSIGPGDPSLLNAITIQTLRDAGKLILRTCRHPIAAWLDGQGILYSSLDDLYDNADDFDMLSEAVARTVWEASENNNETVYAVSDTMTRPPVKDYIYRMVCHCIRYGVDGLIIIF